VGGHIGFFPGIVSVDEETFREDYDDIDKLKRSSAKQRGCGNEESVQL
jgi:hypothetical protein